MTTKVLVIDDETSIRRIFETLFRFREETLLTAPDGESGIELARTEQPHVVISDLKMPGISGIEVLRAVKAMPFHCEVVLMTAYATLDAVMDAVRVEAYEVVTKPFEGTAQIDHLIDRALEKQTMVVERQRLLESLKQANQDLEARVQERTRELQQALDNLHKHQDMLIRQEKMAAVGQMLAGVAHELRNPLGIIENSRLDLQDRLGTGASPELAAGLERIDRQVQRAKKIIQQLLDFSRYGSEGTEIIDVRNLVTLTQQLLEHEIKTHGIMFSAKFQDALPPIKADPDSLKQALLNIMLNAVQALAPQKDRRLNVEVGSSAGAVFISVSDSGPGIMPQHMKDIFNPFFTTKAPGQGTGLGLSLAYVALARAGGRIDVASEAGQGATFTLWLPSAPQTVKI